MHNESRKVNTGREDTVGKCKNRESGAGFARQYGQHQYGEEVKYLSYQFLQPSEPPSEFIPEVTK